MNNTKGGGQGQSVETNGGGSLCTPFITQLPAGWENRSPPPGRSAPTHDNSFKPRKEPWRDWALYLLGGRPRAASLQVWFGSPSRIRRRNTPDAEESSKMMMKKEMISPKDSNAVWRRDWWEGQHLLHPDPYNGSCARLPA